MEKLEAAIEAILFSAGDSVETGNIMPETVESRSWSWMEHFSCVPNRSIMNIWWRLHCSRRKQY